MLRLGNVIMNKMYFLLSEAPNLVGKLTNIFLFKKKVTTQEYNKNGHRILREQCGLNYLERHKDRIRQSIRVWGVTERGNRMRQDICALKIFKMFKLGKHDS